MNCIEFERQTEQWMEGNRGAEAREHAMGCERCRAMVEDLDAIRLAAPQLAMDVEPPKHLWASVRAELEREGLIRQPGWRERMAGWLRTSAYPATATAAAALALALALIFGGLRQQRERPRPANGQPDWLTVEQPELARVDGELDHLERDTIRSFHPSDPAVKEALQQNLMIIDRQIALCEKTLEQAPSDENTHDYLYDAYQQKAELLNMMAERNTGATEGN